VTTRPVWSRPAFEPALSNREVHVWRAFLDQPPNRICQLTLLLSADERARAERFRFERDRRRFIVGRGILRSILGRYLCMAPDRVQFCTGAYGKPHLAASHGCSALCFNLAHSCELVLYALTLGRKVGVDLEYLRPMPDAAQIAQQFFSPFEYETWRALPEAQKQEAFFNCWTRKEAYLKAIGEGMARSLDSFDVSLVPGQPARLYSVNGRSDEAKCWSLTTFVPAANSLATVAVEGSGCRALYLEYPSG